MENFTPFLAHCLSLCETICKILKLLNYTRKEESPVTYIHERCRQQYLFDKCPSLYVQSWTPGVGQNDRLKHVDCRWIKRDQLDVTCFIISLFNAQHVSDVSTSILRSLRHICWVIPWVVLLWFVLQPASGYHTTSADPHCNINTHRTRAIQPMKLLNK